MSFGLERGDREREQNTVKKGGIKRMDSLPLRAIIASLPILMALLLMVLFKVSAARAMPPSWLFTVILAGSIWRMPLQSITAATIEGVLTALSILVIVMGAILLLNTQKNSGSLETISRTFSHISPDRRVQALILGFGLATLIEGASGFGTPAALVAPLLVGIGFPPLAAAIIALIGHSPAVSFGAVGTPILIGIGTSLDLPMVHQSLPIPFSEWIMGPITHWNALFHFMGGALIVPLLVVIYLTFFFGEDRDFKSGLKIWPLAIVAGLTFALVQSITAYLLGPELPSLMGGLSVIIIITILARSSILMPENPWYFPGENICTAEEDQSITPFKAFTPYLLIILLLVFTRIPLFNLKPLFIAPSLMWENILGTPISWRWDWLYNPGIFPFFFVSIFCFFLFKMKREEIKKTFKDTIKQLIPATIAMCSAVAMAQVMMRSSFNLLEMESMLISLAQGSAAIFKGTFPLISPWIGTLGSFISGSNTVSNILFSAYQYEVAMELHVSRTIMVALQSTGAAVGNIISIHNIVAVLTVVGCLGQEGLVIKRNMLALSIYALFTGVLGYVLLKIFTSIF